MRALEATVDLALAVQGGGAHAEQAARAWREYQAHTAEVLRLSRLNTNVLSYALSVHEKRQASTAGQATLEALVSELQLGSPRATR
jgi:hypothetical protein